MGTYCRQSRRGETAEEMVEDRKTTDLPVVRVRGLKTQPHAGDTNHPKCLGFHSVKPRKVRGRSTSPEGRPVLHQAADKSFVRSQELRWTEEGLCTMEDSQSVTGFGGDGGCNEGELREWREETL